MASSKYGPCHWSGRSAEPSTVVNSAAAMRPIGVLLRVGGQREGRPALVVKSSVGLSRRRCRTGGRSGRRRGVLVGAPRGRQVVIGLLEGDPPSARRVVRLGAQHEPVGTEVVGLA